MRSSSLISPTAFSGLFFPCAYIRRGLLSIVLPPAAARSFSMLNPCGRVHIYAHSLSQSRSCLKIYFAWLCTFNLRYILIRNNGSIHLWKFKIIDLHSLFLWHCIYLNIVRRWSLHRLHKCTLRVKRGKPLAAFLECRIFIFWLFRCSSSEARIKIKSKIFHGVTCAAQMCTVFTRNNWFID